MEDIKNKPKMRQFVTQPLNIKQFTDKLVEGLTQEDVKDILFYNFFDLNRFRASGVLSLGKKDVLQRYETKLKQVYAVRNANLLGDQVLEEMQLFSADMNETDIDRIVDDAMKLIKIASRIKEGGNLEDILKGDVDKKFYDMLIDESENPEQNQLKLKLNFYNRYHGIAQQIKD